MRVLPIAVAAAIFGFAGAALAQQQPAPVRGSNQPAGTGHHHAEFRKQRQAGG